MTYALSEALQASVFARLSGDPGLAILVGDAIYDAPLPVAPVDAPELHVTLGEERVRDFGTKTSDGAIHDFTVTVHSSAEGFLSAKAAAGAVCSALIDAPLVLTRGVLVGLRFLFARAERGAPPERRRVALRFRAVLEDSI